MKIIASLLLLLFSLPSFSQIKVVGSDYSKNLSANNQEPTEILSVFEDYDGLSRYATLYNCVGDTVYVAEKKYAWLEINHECKMINDGGEIAPGYYVITGIIIGNDEVEKINEKVIELQSLGFTGEHNPNTGGYSERREFLNEYFTKYKGGKLQYVFAFKMQQVGTDNEIYIKYNSMNYGIIPVRFFNYVCGKMLKNKVYPTNLTPDALTGQEIESKDEFYLCKEIVVGKMAPGSGGDSYDILAILEGQNTGSFAQPIRYWVENQNAFGTVNSNSTFIYCEQDYKKKILKQEEQKALEKARAEKKRKEIIAKYGEKFGNLILVRKVDLGMSKEMCKLAIGSPINTIRSKSSIGTSDIWIYSSTSYLRFENDRLVEIMK